MGRFYFCLRAGDELIRDDEGVDLPDFSAAQREATLAARELLAEAIMSGRPKVPDALVIVDEVGRTLDAVALAAVLPEPLKT
jgi:stage III sporulation protein SpoIIIAA